MGRRLRVARSRPWPRRPLLDSVWTVAAAGVHTNHGPRCGIFKGHSEGATHGKRPHGVRPEIVPINWVEITTLKGQGNVKLSNKGWAIGAAAIALVLVIAGVVFKHDGDFSDKYVHDQLSAQRITFSPTAALTPEQMKIRCLVENAGKPLVSSKQAECYALWQIGLDLKSLYEGKTYAELAYPAKLARDAANAALGTDPTASNPDTPRLLGEAAQLEIPANVMFKGETLKGLLLTSYGFSVLGDRAGQAALVSFILAGLAAVVAIGMFAMATRRRRPDVSVAKTEVA